VLDNSSSRLAGWSAVAAAIAGLIYAVAFVLLGNALLSSLFLLLGGVLATPALVAVRYRLDNVDAASAAWAVMLALAGALGSAIHGGYDLANTINPPKFPVADLPNPVDPRGLLTFGLAGVGLLFVGLLMLRSRRFPKGLAYLALLNGLLSIGLYLGRLIIMDPANLMILVPAAVLGFATNPAFYAWLGIHLLRRSAAGRIGA
jgi:hypothetical protein